MATTVPKKRGRQKRKEAAKPAGTGGPKTAETQRRMRKGSFDEREVAKARANLMAEKRRTDKGRPKELAKLVARVKFLEEVNFLKKRKGTGRRL